MKTNSHAARLYFEENFLIIDPDGSFKTKWNFLIVILILYSIIVTPYRIAFSPTLQGRVDSLNFSFFLEIFVETVLVMDIIINFFQAYYDEEENLVISRNKIVVNYLQGWFIIDMGTSLPASYVNLIMYYYSIQSASMYNFYITFKWLKVLRIIKLLNNNSYQENLVYRLLFSEKN